MKDNNIISYQKALNACNLLKTCPNTRIPRTDIEEFIEELEK